MARHGAASKFLIAAVHGGDIEPGTSEIARAVAGVRYGLYLFEGHLGWDHSFDALHISSNDFDEPEFNRVAPLHQTIITIHGCRDKWGAAVLIGGCHSGLKQKFAHALSTVGLEGKITGHIFTGDLPENVCNRGIFGQGLQIEVPEKLRDCEVARRQIVAAISNILAIP